MSEQPLSIFGNVLAEPGWPSVVGIVERFMHLVDEKHFVDNNSSKRECYLLSAYVMPGTAGQVSIHYYLSSFYSSKKNESYYSHFREEVGPELGFEPWAF